MSLTVGAGEFVAVMGADRLGQEHAAALHLVERSVEKHVTAIVTELDLPQARTDHRRAPAVPRYLGS